MNQQDLRIEITPIHLPRKVGCNLRVCVLPGCREGADPGKENRWLNIDVDSQRQLPVVALNFSCSSRVLEVQHSFQSLH